MAAVLHATSLRSQPTVGMLSANANADASSISMEQNNSTLNVTFNNGGGHFDENVEAQKCDGLVVPNNDRSLNASKISGNSPRYEAFVMTGDKILRLNPKISPSYAKLKQSELPSHVQVLSDSSPVRGPFSDLENNFHYHNASYLKGKGGVVAAGGETTASNGGCRGDDDVREATQSVENGEAEFRQKISASLNEISVQKCKLGDDGRPSSFMDDDENVFTFDKNASLITVPGNFTFGHSISTNSGLPATHSLRMYDDFGSGLFDLPSPISPAFISEPSTPAKFAFNNGKTNVVKKNVDKKEPFTKSLSSFDEIVPEEPKATKTLDKGFEPASKFVDSNNQSKLSNCTLSSISPSSVSSSLSSPTPIKEKLLHLDSNLSPQQLGQNLTDKDIDAAKRVAKRLYALDGFKKSDVAKNLSKNNEFGNLVAVEYLNLFDFTGLKLDESIRKLLNHFCLTGETSERERILWYFSRRYHECNSTVFHAEDEVHTLTCALLLLNTDLHGQNVNKRMSCNDFIENISQTGFRYSKSLLKSLYHSIKRMPIEWAKDNGTTPQFGKKKLSMNLRAVGFTDHESQIVHKKGWVMRKCMIEDNGKNTPFGRRSWRMFYATLKGMMLYLHQDENGFKKGSFLTFRNSIRIHHAFALAATDYCKKQNVFRLQTATSAEYLFQASDPNEMAEWMDEINFVAARYSTPCLPSAVGSRDSVLSTSKSSLRRRPSTLPVSRTKFSYNEQLRNHEFRLDELQKQLDANHKALPSRSAKSKILQHYAENEIFLLMELQRYSTYIRLLQSRLNNSSTAEPSQGVSMVTSTANPLTNLSEVLEVASNEDLRNNNGHGVVNTVSSGNGKLSNSETSHLTTTDKNNCTKTDRNSYKAAISDSMSLKEIYETNF